jgi:hypothetical protein
MIREAFLLMVCLDRYEVQIFFWTTFIFHLNFVFTLIFKKLAPLQVPFSPGLLTGRGISVE